MGWVAKDLPTLIFMLLPGFLSAGLYYALTAHPKTSEFERIVQALIFTVILKVLTSIVRWFALVLGSVAPIGRWTASVDLGWSVMMAFVVGITVSVATNNNTFYKRLRDWPWTSRWTSRTSYPSEWYSAFARMQCWVVIHLKDGRRLFGWPEEWPDQPDKGHFVIEQPEWLLKDNTRAPLYRVKRLMIPASDVGMVEFQKPRREVEQSAEELARVDKLLIQTREAKSDGSEGPAASPESG